MDSDLAHDHAPVLGTRLTGRLPRRVRVSLACTSCRRRKSRCDGVRPTCSPCLELRLSCRYEDLQAPEKNGKRRDGQLTYAQLAQRVKELEARLNPVTVEPAVESSSPATETVTMDHETAVDSLATNALTDEVPQMEIGYFGPTSNHALFRTLSSAFACRVPLMHPSQQYSTEGSVREHIDHPLQSSPGSLSRSPSRQIDGLSTSVDPFALPSQRDLLGLVNQFFATIGIVLPYVDRSSLLNDGVYPGQRSIWQSSKPGRALLNIICAHAAFTLRSMDAEVFYRRTLSLLDELTLRGSSLELVQALLLLCCFQQNSQRSIASWTYHAIAVKAALQLGLHSSASYDEHGMQKRELLKRLWFGIINQDSYLSISLGRPCLIPPDNIRVAPPLNYPPSMESIPACSRSHSDNLAYYNLFISLQKIKSMVVEALYDRNIGSSESAALEKVVAKRLHLIFELERWRDSCAPTFSVLSSTELGTWFIASYDANRFRVLLSIQYYSTALLINGPILTGILTERRPDKSAFHPLMDEVILAVKQDFATARELDQIVHHLAVSSPSFVDQNAAWWFCNFIMFTVNLHFFGILLACHRDNSMPLQKVLDSSEIRDALESGLQTLELIERSSLMSRKGRHCLRRFLQVFDTLVPYQRATLPAAADTASIGTIPPAPLDDYYSQFITESADDFLLQSSQLAFLDTDISMAGFSSSSQTFL